MGAWRMQNLQTAAPDPRLAPFVRCFAQRETMPGSLPEIQAVIASLENILTFDLCEPTIISYPAGVVTGRAPIALLGPRTTTEELPLSAVMFSVSVSSSGPSRHGDCSASPPLRWLALIATRRRFLGRGSQTFGTNLALAAPLPRGSWLQPKLCSGSLTPPAR